MIRVSVHAVDGSLQEWDAPDAIVKRLRELRGDGLRGRSLIHGLLTDDWAAPPSTVTISGTLGTGEHVRYAISYE
jgi:hypothetical protein